MGQIVWQYANNPQWLMRLDFSDNLVYDNTDPTVKITTNISGYGEQTIYNSCFGHYINNYNEDVLFFCLFFSASSYMRLQYTSNGGVSWTTQQYYDIRQDPNSNFWYVYNNQFSPLFQVANINGVDVPYQMLNVQPIVDNNVTTNNCHFEDTLQGYANYCFGSPISYNWSSVPSISGKNGILSLSMIKDSKLGDLTGGSGLSESEYMDRFTSQSNLYGYGNNMAKGDEITIAYSGENYLNLYKDNTGYLYLKFYFRSGVLIYTSPQFVTYPTSPKYLCMVIDEEQHVVQPIVVTYYPSSDTVEWSSYNPSDTEMSALYSWLQYGTPEASPYLQGSSDNGGDNYHLTPQDDFESNLFPNLTGLATHLFTVYCPTDSQLQSLSNFLWSDDLISNIKKYFGNVSEAIVSLYMLPYKPDNLPTKKFKIGSVTYDDGPSDVEYLSNTRYVTVSMGSFPIDPVFDSYLDYEPYTKLSIYLPFIGIQQLSVDEFMCKAEKSGALSESTGSTIDIEYRIDLLTGGCVAYIKQGTQVKYQFSGKCGATLPISGQNYNNMVGGLVQAISGFATTIASGGLTAPMSISASVSGTVNASKPDLFKAGNLSGELSLLSYNRPMIIKTRPNINIDMADQIKVDGLPSYKVKTIGSYSGFISCIAVHVDGINCTQEEKDKIHSYLLEGVIV